LDLRVFHTPQQTLLRKNQSAVVDLPRATMSIQSTIVYTAIALWVAQGWYLNTRLNHVHDKLDQMLDELRQDSDDDTALDFYEVSADTD
jgi:hypothetical protein